MRQLMRIFFPILPIKLDYHHIQWLLIEAVDIHIHSIGIGSGHIERFDATGFTEVVLGYTAVECVSVEMLLACDNRKPGARDYQMQVAGHGANRTVAAFHLNWRIRFHLESNPTTMTTALEFHLVSVPIAINRNHHPHRHQRNPENYHRVAKQFSILCDLLPKAKAHKLSKSL